MTTPIKTNNRDASSYVQRRLDFQGSNVFGTVENYLYVVYSYGYHYPMFIYDYHNKQWLENGDKSSRSTERQRTQLRPTSNTIKLTTEQMEAVIQAGSLTAIVQTHAA